MAIRSNTVNLFDGYFELFFGFLMRREMRLYSPLIASMFFVATRSENLFDGSFELFLQQGDSHLLRRSGLVKQSQSTHEMEGQEG